VKVHFGCPAGCFRSWPVALTLRCLVLSVLLSPGAPAEEPRQDSVGQYIDTGTLLLQDSCWKVVRQDVTADRGRIKLHNNRWLMFFVHWRPLKATAHLTFEYARDHMLNFWGPAMPFTLSGGENEIEVAGHRALVINGTIYEGRIATRFIVWNCPETGRQFTADCNVNLARGTPPSLLDVQQAIAGGVRCHAPYAVAGGTAFPEHFLSNEWGVSLSVPDKWHTEKFASKEWFPDGITYTSGSLWTLLTTSEKRLDLRWQRSDDEVSAAEFRWFLHELPADSAVVRDSTLTLQVYLDTVFSREAFLEGTGSLRYSRSLDDRTYESHYRFDAILWKDVDRLFFLMASLVSIDEFWGLPVNLVVSDEMVSRFLWDEIVPQTKTFNSAGGK